MANILIASLGDSPIVVTAMVKTLRETKSLQIDRVILLYPEQHPQINDGVALIQEHCLCRNVDLCGFPFSDANTEDRCFEFLQTLHGLLEAAQAQNDTVYLSPAGGRKSMSALVALLASFYDNIAGLYHIVDKREGTNKANFHELESLLDSYCKDDPRLATVVNPLLEDLALMEIPFGHFADAKHLRKILGTLDAGTTLKSTPVDLDRLSPETFEFWSSIFHKESAPEYNEICLSQVAKEQFEKETVAGSERRSNFLRFFGKLKSPAWANHGAGKGQAGGKHATFTGKDSHFYVAKMIAAERIVWYQAGNQVVIAELALEQNDRRYYRLSGHTVLDRYFFQEKSRTEYQPVIGLQDVGVGENILLAALGKSPMVVTQAYKLLERFEYVKINKVALVYPKRNGEIENGARLLKEVFKRKNVEVIVPCEVNLIDIDSTEACKSFLEAFSAAIDKLIKDFPTADLRLLLSGGRKGMTILSYLTAQRSNITKVYHTLIKDSKLEKQIEQEGSLQELQKLGSSAKRVQKMFLEDYSEHDFALFRIPVIPFTM